MSRREEGREVMNGCHQVNGSRRSLRVKSKWEGDGESNKEFSCKRWSRRSYKRSKLMVSNRICAKYSRGSDFASTLKLLSALSGLLDYFSVS